MKSAKEIAEEQSADSIKARKIYENEKKYFEDILSQCNEETKKESIKKLNVTHYILDNGLHVYMGKENWNGFNIIIVPEELAMDEMENFESSISGVKLNTNGAFVIIRKDRKIDLESNDVSYPISRIEYRIKDENIFICDPICDSNIERKYLNGIPDGAETMLDVLLEKVDMNKNASEIEKTLAKDRLSRIYSGLDREDLKTYTPEELKIIQLESELEQLRSENEQSKSKVDSVEAENRTLRAENDRFIVALDKAREQMLRMRRFIVDRCGRIPFVGKSILKAMNEELGVNELDAPQEER